MKSTIVILLLVVAAFAVAQSGPSEPVFPIAPGAYWVYRGDVTFNLTPNQVTTATISRRMQVTATAQGPNFRAAMIKGGPWDLAFYSPQKPPGDYLIMTTPEAAFFVEGPQAVEIFHEIQRHGLQHETRDKLAENIWFRLPLHANSVFCAPDQIPRTDGMYCWTVTDTKSEHIAGIAGVKPGTRTVYGLEFRTNPDHESVDIVPGIGMTRFEYGHNGTPSSTEVRLVEYHAGKAESH